MRNSFSYLLPSILAIILHVVVMGILISNWSEAAPPQSVGEDSYYIRANLVSENPYIQRESQEDRQIKSKQSSIDVPPSRVPYYPSKSSALSVDEDAHQADKRADVLHPKSETSTEKLTDAVIEPLIKLKKPLMILGFRAEDARIAVKDSEKTQVYISQIQRDIVQNWSRPPSARNGMQAQLRVFLVPTGEVVEVILEKKSGNDAFDRSAVLAVTKAERFLVPSDSRQFEKNFREFTILFRPEDLRL